MTETAQVFIRENGRKSRLVGELSRVVHHNQCQYIFRYDDAYLADESAPNISLTLPKTQQEYVSDRLFPYFLGLVSEGWYKAMQLSQLKIDENDDFLLLVTTARYNTPDGTTFRLRKNKTK